MLIWELTKPSAAFPIRTVTRHLRVALASPQTVWIWTSTRGHKAVRRYNADAVVRPPQSQLTLRHQVQPFGS